MVFSRNQKIKIIYVGINRIAVLFITLILIACSPKEKLQNRAISDAKNMIEKMANDPDNFDIDIRLEDITPVYESDSLCILNLKIKHQNSFGMDINQRIEFIHFGNLWFSHSPDDKDAPVFLSKEFLEKNKKGKIYENFTYDDAIYYRAALYCNKMSEDGSLFIPLRTGLWDLENNEDDSPNDPDGNHLVLRSYECFKDGEKSEDKAEIVVSKKDIYLSISNSLWIWHNCTCSINHSNGMSYGPWPIHEEDKRIMPSRNKKDINDNIRLLLEEEGTMTIIIQHSLLMGETRKYEFNMNLAGYKEASRFLK